MVELKPLPKAWTVGPRPLCGFNSRCALGGSGCFGAWMVKKNQKTIENSYRVFFGWPETQDEAANRCWKDIYDYIYIMICIEWYIYNDIFIWYIYIWYIYTYIWYILVKAKLMNVQLHSWFSCWTWRCSFFKYGNYIFQVFGMSIGWASKLGCFMFRNRWRILSSETSSFRARMCRC